MDIFQYQIQKVGYQVFIKTNDSITFQIQHAETSSIVSIQYNFKNDFLISTMFKIESSLKDIYNLINTDPRLSQQGLKYLGNYTFSILSEEPNQIKSSAQASYILKSNIDLVMNIFDNISNNLKTSDDCFLLRVDKSVYENFSNQQVPDNFAPFDLLFSLDETKCPKKIMTLIPDEKNENEFFFCEEDFTDELDINDYITKVFDLG